MRIKIEYEDTKRYYYILLDDVLKELKLNKKDMKFTKQQFKEAILRILARV